ncbi:hypothetical protein [Sphingomonas sp.]|uniref:hypothetical protein n=1 Tax=Sphingomonas sp. TaxID=28214 RepID=UPI00286D69B2|nr:hypothetical protein [Sphingomonas sp.]
MQFLKTLFWVLLAVILVLFASRNWSDATLNLWGDIQVDIKLPVLMLVVFLLGFLPVFLVHRTRLWSLKRRLEVEQRHQALAAQPTPADEAASTL